MTLQSRLADLVAAVGADIKSHGTRLTTVEAANRYDTAPIGAVLSWSRKTFPEGYVLADGFRYANADYPQGYAAAQAEVAAGNSLWTVRASDQTFTVPNLTDKFIFSRAPANMGGTGGEASHTLSVDEMPTHAHDISINGPGAYGTYIADGNVRNLAPNSGTVVGTTQGAGGGVAHNNMPPWVALAQIVKVGGVTASGAVIQGPPGPQGPAYEYAFRSGGWGTSIATAANLWKTIPLSVAGGDDVIPAGAFTVNADGSVTVRDAGRYQINAEVQVQGSAGGAESASVGSNPDGQNYMVEMSQAGGGAANYPVLSGGTVINLAAGTKLYVTAVTPNAASGQVKGFSMHRIGTGPIGPVASVTQEGWHTVGAAGEPAFQSGFTAPEPLKFYKDPAGVVHMVGRVQTGAQGNLIFTLPVGYRPTQTTRIPINANGSFGSVDIGPNGDIVPYAGTVWWDLSGVQFSTGQTTFPAGKSIIPVVSALPGGTDGDEVYYQSAAMALDGVMWHLRYRAASTSIYKWEIVGGGTQLSSEVAAEESTLSGAFVDLATVGPQITVPLAGDYMVSGFVDAYSVASADAAPYAAVKFGAAAINGADRVYLYRPGNVAQGFRGGVGGRTFRRTIAANALVKLMYSNANNTGANVYFGSRVLQIAPIRVG